MVSTAFGAELKQEAPPETPEGKEKVLQSEALLPSEDDSTAPAAVTDATLLSTDFEISAGISPGFTTGYCYQNSWTAFSTSSNQGQVSNINPFSGDQHLRLGYDSSVPRNNFIGCFSPVASPQVPGPAWMEVTVSISGRYGADYYVVVQSSSEDLITAYVNFDWLGNIWVADDLGSGGVWVDTGQAWNIGTQTLLRIQIDPTANRIDYYYDGALIYIGQVWAGSTFEQVVLFHDNWNTEDVGDFDFLQVNSGTYPTAVNLVSFQGESVTDLPVWTIRAALITLLIPLALIVRKRSVSLTDA
jgi:hypothetical protein